MCCILVFYSLIQVPKSPAAINEEEQCEWVSYLYIHAVSGGIYELRLSLVNFISIFFYSIFFYSLCIVLFVK